MPGADAHDPSTDRVPRRCANTPGRGRSRAVRIDVTKHRGIPSERTGHLLEYARRLGPERREPKPVEERDQRYVVTSSPMAYLIQHVEFKTPAFYRIVRELMTLAVNGVDITVEMVARMIARDEEFEARIAAARERDEGEQPPIPEPVPLPRSNVEAGRFAAVNVRGNVVYYARIGNRVKIGTSYDLRARLTVINPEELLAIERGSYELEAQRHREFRELHTHGEWFRYEGPLVDHVRALQGGDHAR